MVELICDDVMAGLRSIPDHSVNMAVTSPPYYGLRSYGITPRVWEDGSTSVLGEEDSLEEYIAHLVWIFRELKRVLHPTGTFWLNMGDCYASGGKHVEQIKYANCEKPVRKRQARLTGKDLLMVPARVAIALQESHEIHQIQLSENRAWLAALIDGEGCISIRRYIAHNGNESKKRCQDGFVAFLTIGNNDKELLDRCVTITNLGKVSLKTAADTTDGRGIVSRRDQYCWRLEANQAIKVIKDVYPYLIAKRKQAALAYTLAISNKNGKVLRGWQKPLPNSEQLKREKLKELINKCNQRDVVDIPNWVIAPKIEIEQGWILRNDIIWCKGYSFGPGGGGSVMPESTKDRCTWSHEHVFQLSLQPDYFYDQDGCREPYAESTVTEAKGKGYRGQGRKAYAKAGAQNPSDVKSRVLAAVADGNGRNLRNVWMIPKQNYRGAHRATFPEALIEPVVRLGTSEKGACPHCHAQWKRRTIREAIPQAIQAQFEAARQATVADTGRTDGHTHRRPNFRRAIIGTEWEPGCQCSPNEPIPATVLDPFSGSGRAGIVAVKLGRSYIGIDQSRSYCEMAERDINEISSIPSGSCPVEYSMESISTADTMDHIHLGAN